MPSYRESIVAYIACDPPAVLWSGVGPLPLPADTVVPAPTIALGGSELIDFPDFQQLLGGTAERIDFIISGVSEEAMRLALDDAPSVRGATVHVGTASFADDWSLSGIEWEAVFEARSLMVSRPTANGGKITRTVTLTIVQGATTRSRAPNAYFTDADQRRQSPTDAIFSHVAGITAGTSRRFGPND
jgi:hypothetical protein